MVYCYPHYANDEIKVLCYSLVNGKPKAEFKCRSSCHCWFAFLSVTLLCIFTHSLRSFSRRLNAFQPPRGFVKKWVWLFSRHRLTFCFLVIGRPVTYEGTSRSLGKMECKIGLSSGHLAYVPHWSVCVWSPALVPVFSFRLMQTGRQQQWLK